VDRRSRLARCARFWTKEGALVLSRIRWCNGDHSKREYQTQLENLYLSALALTLQSFRIRPALVCHQHTIFQQFGSTETGINNLTTTSHAGFTRNLSWVDRF